MQVKEATQFLTRLEQGDADAAEELLPVVYDELRAIARSYLRRQRSDHTLQPTALVHEAYLKIMRGATVDWQSQAHFRAVAATAMRSILINHAEAKRAAKRGGGADRVSLDRVTIADNGRPLDVIELDDALHELEAVDPDLSRVVELWFFGGLNMEEVGVVLGVSQRTVKRRWRAARSFLNTSIQERLG